MKTIEVKGFWGFLFFSLAGLLALAVVVSVPISVVWVSWNAFVGEVFQGPMISFWQASILTAIIAVTCQIVFQPQISFQVKRIKTPDEK